MLFERSSARLTAAWKIQQKTQKCRNSRHRSNPRLRALRGFPPSWNRLHIIGRQWLWVSVPVSLMDMQRKAHTLMSWAWVQTDVHVLTSQNLKVGFNQMRFLWLDGYPQPGYQCVSRVRVGDVTQTQLVISAEQVKEGRLWRAHRRIFERFLSSRELL